MSAKAELEALRSARGRGARDLMAAALNMEPVV